MVIEITNVQRIDMLHKLYRSYFLHPIHMSILFFYIDYLNPSCKIDSKPNWVIWESKSNRKMPSGKWYHMKWFHSWMELCRFLLWLKFVKYGLVGLVIHFIDWTKSLRPQIDLRLGSLKSEKFDIRKYLFVIFLSV